MLVLQEPKFANIKDPSLANGYKGPFRITSIDDIDPKLYKYTLRRIYPDYFDPKYKKFITLTYNEFEEIPGFEMGLAKFKTGDIVRYREDIRCIDKGPFQISGCFLNKKKYRYSISSYNGSKCNSGGHLTPEDYLYKNEIYEDYLNNKLKFIPGNFCVIKSLTDKECYSYLYVYIDSVIEDKPEHITENYYLVYFSNCRTNHLFPVKESSLLSYIDYKNYNEHLVGYLPDTKGETIGDILDDIEIIKKRYNN